MRPSPPAEAARVNLASTVEVNYWCQTLNCTETRLRNAVLAVGPLATDVQVYLQRKKRPRNSFCHLDRLTERLRC